MFPFGSPTFSKLKCPRLETCPYPAKSCVFSHDPAVFVKGGLDGRIGLSSLTYFKDLQQRIRSEEAACKESVLFSNKESHEKQHEQSSTLSRAIENDLSKFLHRAPAGCKISASLREKVLLKLIKAMRQADAGSSLGQAAEIEAELLKKSGGTVSSVYLSSVSEYIKRLSDEKSDNLSNVSDKDHCNVTYEDLMEVLADKASLREYTYPQVSEDPNENSIYIACTETPRQCRRCGITFIPAHHYTQDNLESVCRYHSERPERIGGLRVYGCCHAPVGDSNGCTSSSKHVFEGFKQGDPAPKFSRLPAVNVRKNAVALDAEMSYTVGGYEASRVTLVDFFTEATLLDVLVMPQCSPVLDYNTKWSGVSEESFRSGEYPVLSFEEAKKQLAAFIGPETILIGHSLDNDLRVLEFAHELIVDTAILYPHKARPPFRMSLKALALGHLSELVQQSLTGHDSKEDCLTCIRLVKKYFHTGKR